MSSLLTQTETTTAWGLTDLLCNPRYKELCDQRSHCPLDFQGCLDATTSGVFHAVALSEEALDNEQQPSGDMGDPCSLTLLEVLDKHAAVQKDKTVFASALPRALISHSWRSYARRNVRRETLLYAAMVLSFSAAAIVSQLACSSAAASTNRTRLDEEETSVLLIHGAINAATSLIATLLLLRLLYREVIQLRDDSLLEYIRDGWNCFQVPSYFVALASIAYHSLDVVRLWQQNEDPELDVLCDDSEQAKRELHAFAGGAVWLGALFYMRGFERTAVAVPIIRQICIDVAPYLFVLAMILIGFAFAFMNLQHIDTIDSEVSTRYSSPAMAVLSSFSMMMGSFNVEDFTPDPTAERVTVFVVFMVFVQLVMLNMLIAIMGDSVATVRATEKAALMRAQADLILESRVFMSHKDLQDPQRFPQSFTIKMPNQVKVKTTKQLMSKQMPKMESRMNCKPRTALPHAGAAADCRARAVQRL